ncbi:MAG: aspartate-semialdehyde dehydrogenase [Bacteroidales bacterium]|nr:aspartate-semialdehyde dehydrogenase [Bacteroidales bacterium]
MKIAVVGATGLVGSKMLQVLDEQKIKMDELIVAASEKSVGKEIVFQGRGHRVIRVEDAIEARPDIAIFSAGASASKQYAPLFAAKGSYVIDNSSAWRMFPEVPLVVPEINADTITKDTHIIANPNCSTIQMVLALNPLHKAFDVKRLVIATYQSVSGSGVKGIGQLDREEGRTECSSLPNAYPHQIYRNVLPHGGDFCENGYTTEEEKLVNETRKILRAPQIAVTATVCRVPVTGGHSEAVNVEFNKPFELDEVRRLLECQPGVVVQDDPAHNLYPMAITSYDKDEVFVGRIRRDFSVAKGLNLWVVSDNIRKGAATNAVQIAKYVIDHIL